MVSLSATAVPEEESAEQYLQETMKTLVGFGPERIAGSEANRKQAEWIVSELKRLGFADAHLQEFDTMTPDGQYRMQNVVATLVKEGSVASQKLLLTAHYDLKKLPSPGMEGANDGASGVAVLLEVAREIARNGAEQSYPYPVELVLFDGEECRIQYDKIDGLHGSRYYAETASQESGGKPANVIRAIINVDMVGDQDLALELAPNSNKVLLLAFLHASEQAGTREALSPFTGPRNFIDDHAPLQKLGVPALNLIDFDYGPRNQYWHTAQDSLANCSITSLQSVAATLGILIQQLP